VWIVGRVVAVMPGFEGDYRSGSPNRATLYIKSGSDTISIVCFQSHLPEDILRHYVRVDVRLREIRLPRYPMRRFEELYEAENYPGVIRVLGRRLARVLRRLGEVD
jgi:hypothetical protein